MKKIAIVLIMIALFSCKTTRETVKINETKKETATSQVQQTSTSQTRESINTIEQLIEADSAVITETETVFSKPDSAGRQYPEKIIERKIETGKKREQGKVTTAQKETVNKKSEVKKSEVKTETTADTKVKTKQKQQLPWKIAILIIGFAVIAFFIIRNRLIRNR